MDLLLAQHLGVRDDLLVHGILALEDAHSDPPYVSRIDEHVRCFSTIDDIVIWHEDRIVEPAAWHLWSACLVPEADIDDGEAHPLSENVVVYFLLSISQRKDASSRWRAPISWQEALDARYDCSIDQGDL
jgi:hypothetical protein